METKYLNQEIITKTDEIADSFLKLKNSNKHRDKFFPYMVDTMGLNFGVEIGVDKGEFAVHFLQNTKIKKYFCIDTWQDNFGSDHVRKGCDGKYFDNNGNVRYNQASNNLKKYIDENRAVMMRMTSTQAALYFKKETIDFCYIDGDHSLEGVYADIKAWLPKIKVGGIIAGHDYKDGPRSGITGYNGGQLDYKIKTVVDYYCQRYGHKLNITGGRILSWWFVKNIQTEDHVGIYMLEDPTNG